jgi:hypothetical protein
LNMKSIVARPMIVVAAVYVAGATIVGALAFCGVSIYFALAPAVGAATAALIAGGVLGVLGVTAGLAAYVAAKSPRPGTLESDSKAALGLLLGRELVALSRTHPAATIVGALAAGIAAGASPDLRRALGSLLR